VKLYRTRVGSKWLMVSKEDLAHLEHLRVISEAKPSAVAAVGKR
jgi:hypothetical protein